MRGVNQKKPDMIRQLNQAATLLDFISDALFALDHNWRYIYVNPQGLALARKKREEILGVSLWDLFPDLIGTEVERRFRRALKNKRREIFEYYYEPYGLWVEYRLYPADGVLLELVADITERKKLEQELQTYAIKVTQAQEEEKRRIARELHDDTSQYLALLSLELYSLLKHPAIQSVSELQDRIIRLKEDTDKAVNNVRRFSHELMPGVLENLGLEAALEQLATEAEQNTHLKIKLDVQGKECPTRDDKKLTLFRIAQEALNNILKHAEASRVTMELKCLQDAIHLAITDNGKGFNVDSESSKALEQGNLGLLSIRERTRLIGADLKIESQPGKGTRVEIKAKL